MNKGILAGCTIFVLLILSVSPGLATPTVDVGTHYLYANRQYTFPIVVSTSTQNPDDSIRAMALYLQVGDGGSVNTNAQHTGSDIAPRIIDMDGTGAGTLFYLSGASADIYHLPDTGGNYLIWKANVALPDGAAPRAANGTLAYVTVDTTGTSPGFSRPLTANNVATYYLNDPLNFPNGWTTHLGPVPNTPPPSPLIIPTINNGQIVIVGLPMTWTGTTGNWTNNTWTNSPPTFPDYTADAIVNTVPAVVNVDAAREANSLAVSNGRVTLAAAGSLHLTTNLNLNPSGTLAIVSGGSLTGGASSAIQMSGGKLSGSGGSVAITLPVSVSAGTTNSLETPGAADALTINGPLAIHNSGTALNKDGLGTLTIPATSAQTYDPNTVFNANAGIANIAGTTGANLTANASGGTFSFTNVAQTLAGLGLSNGGTVQAMMGLTNTATHVGTGGGTLFVDASKTVTTGALSVAAGSMLIKTGAGTMTVNGPQNLDSGAVLKFGSGSGPSPQLRTPQGVPEPSTLVLLAIGAIALLLFRRRR